MTRKRRRGRIPTKDALSLTFMVQRVHFVLDFVVCRTTGTAARDSSECRASNHHRTAVDMSVLDGVARVDPLSVLSGFREDLYAYLDVRGEGLFELVDALLCTDGP